MARLRPRYLEVPQMRAVVMGVHANLTAVDTAFKEITSVAPGFVICAGDVALQCFRRTTHLPHQVSHVGK